MSHKKKKKMGENFLQEDDISYITLAISSFCYKNVYVKT